jgi:asparagine synthase (glutamine-hydrolysing)
MCGIVGIVHRDRQRRVDASRLALMRDLQTHRGPDDSGSYLSGPAGLGHRRLSIIDLSSGHQPMTNEDGTLWIVFNGEIYNFRALRDRLVARGHEFRTRSDTEVILHLYEEEGADCVRSLNGIFAFAIWNSRDETLFVARDHVGVKPLYYAITDEAFVFASEAKSIVGSGYVEPRLRDEAVYEYFVFRHVAGEETLYRDVLSLLPGHRLMLRDGRVHVDRYWSPDAANAGFPRTLAAAADHLEQLLEDAVRMQMVSDVPLGTFCSGGVDSSLVTALAARSSGSPINTFSVGFHEQAFDETSYARTVAERYGTRHHELKLDAREFADLLPKMIWHNDGPLNFANSVHIYAISRLAKEFVTVVLTGEGADELLAGYPRYLVPAFAGYYNRLPAFLRQAAAGVARRLGNHRLDKVRRYSRYEPAQALLFNACVVNPELAGEVVRNVNGRRFAYREACLEEAGETQSGSIGKVSALDQRTYLVSILERQDKMSMAASIESRVPFLDYRLVEFAAALPARFKVRRFDTKHLVKRIARKYLPEVVVDRPKSGFGVPLHTWLNDGGGLRRYVEALSSSPSIDRHLDRELLARLVEEHQSGSADHSEFLWTSVNFMLWADGLRDASAALGRQKVG